MSSPAVVTPVTWTVAIKDTGGTTRILDTVESIEVRDGLAPIVPSVRVSLVKAKRMTAPAGIAELDPPIYFPAQTSDLTIGCTAWAASRVYAIARSSAVQSGPDLRLSIEGLDPRSSRLARAVMVPTGYGYRMDFNPGGVGNYGGSTFPTYMAPSGVPWQRGQVYQAIFNAANAGAGGGDLGRFVAGDYAQLAGTGAPAGYDATVTGCWYLDGMTCMEGVLTVLGARGRWSFYVPRTGALSVVDLAPTSGFTVATLDLTAMPDLLSWELIRDQSTMVERVDVVAACDLRVTTMTFGLVSGEDWTSADETAYDAGVRGGPAFRRFGLLGSVDGESSDNWLVDGTCPMDQTGVAKLYETQPAAVYWYDGTKWVGQPANITADGSVIYIDGGDALITKYRAQRQLKLTVCLQRISVLSASSTVTSNTGMGGVALRRNSNAIQVKVLAGTVYGVDGAGALLQTASDTSDIVGDLNKELADLKPLVQRFRPQLSWTRQGIIEAHPPGTSIAIANLPGLGNFTLNGVVLERIQQQSGPDAQTTWKVDYPPASQVGQI